MEDFGIAVEGYDQLIGVVDLVGQLDEVVLKQSRRRLGRIRGALELADVGLVEEQRRCEVPETVPQERTAQGGGVVTAVEVEVLDRVLAGAASVEPIVPEVGAERALKLVVSGLGLEGGDGSFRATELGLVGGRVDLH